MINKTSEQITISNKTESVSKTSHQTEIQDHMASLCEFYLTFKEFIPILLKFFPKEIKNGRDVSKLI